jgi:hypothetical protein
MLTQKFEQNRFMNVKKKYSGYFMNFHIQQLWIVQSWKKEGAKKTTNPFLLLFPPNSNYMLSYNAKPLLVTHREERR